MALEFRDVSFRYNRKTTVLDGFDLRVSSPATVLLGPNGAGKSTLMALAASQLKPLDGAVTWKGRSPTARRDVTAYRKAVAWLPQHITPVPGLTVREQVAYAGWLKGMNRTDAWKASAVTLGRVGLDKLADRRSHQVSGGQLRRMGIAGALTHHSELILMDEPTAGLDPTQRKVFRSLLEQLADDVHILVSTHQTEDLADLYQHVVVLDRGTVRFHGTTAAFHAMADNADNVQGPRERAEAAYAQLVGEEI
ncbi:ATP-binding cassette domain-containing protein [Streptomyces melanosporofaciens]|uniref:ABC-type multidrug transport system, ATPase component n=1 Tax=Streptomyces melanosporofaciens TaxID=67327 RepID=A0A1H4ICV9_STRMJ|nr:ATP-binding cassette domain-containing protein [Streptomyces melanosporofaciens]SEB31168.1 ABC-type multidrug transport system, ATPase component [Streptomyces melanosporofaciens]